MTQPHINKPPECSGFLYDVKVFSLEVFQEFKLRNRLIVGLKDPDGDILDPRDVTRPPATLPGDDHVFVAAFHNNDGFQEPIHLYGLRQFFQFPRSNCFLGWSMFGYI
jgi:hypothetical protein